MQSKEYNEEQKLLITRQKRTFIDNDTGEVFEADQIIKRFYGQKQFWKVYLMDFLHVLGIVDSKQLDVLIYILENTEPANNTFIGTQENIREKTNISIPTIRRIIRKLEEHKFIKKIQQGVWQINPNIMMKGSNYKKSLLINYYDDEEPIKKTMKKYKINDDENNKIYEIEESEKVYGEITIDKLIK